MTLHRENLALFEIPFDFPLYIHSDGSVTDSPTQTISLEAFRPSNSIHPGSNPIDINSASHWDSIRGQLHNSESTKWCPPDLPEIVDGQSMTLDQMVTIPDNLNISHQDYFPNQNQTHFGSDSNSIMNLDMLNSHELGFSPTHPEYKRKLDLNSSIQTVLNQKRCKTGIDTQLSDDSNCFSYYSQPLSFQSLPLSHQPNSFSDFNNCSSFTGILPNNNDQNSSNGNNIVDMNIHNLFNQSQMSFDSYPDMFSNYTPEMNLNNQSLDSSPNDFVKNEVDFIFDTTANLNDPSLLNTSDLQLTDKLMNPSTIPNQSSSFQLHQDISLVSNENLDNLSIFNIKPNTDYTQDVNTSHKVANTIVNGFASLQSFGDALNRPEANLQNNNLKSNDKFTSLDVKQNDTQAKSSNGPCPLLELKSRMSKRNEEARKLKTWLGFGRETNRVFCGDKDEVSKKSPPLQTVNKSYNTKDKVESKIEYPKCSRSLDTQSPFMISADVYQSCIPPKVNAPRIRSYSVNDMAMKDHNSDFCKKDTKSSVLVSIEENDVPQAAEKKPDTRKKSRARSNSLQIDSAESIEPRQQKLKHDLDNYTPKWVRFTGFRKEGLCELCKPTRWLQLKNSAYWYHKQYTHGVSSVTGAYFQNPVDIRTVWYEDQVQSRSEERNITIHIMTEGKCHVCCEWIPLSKLKKRFSFGFANYQTAINSLTSVVSGQSAPSEVLSSNPLKVIVARNSLNQVLVPFGINVNTQVLDDIRTHESGQLDGVWWKHCHKCHTNDSKID
ncbi:hypothetical protein BC833DRAFT_648325 [Globomyces pollinis-pini]|nr:hypothetical protein BC833DRAFT_648325 [Globomyces pollinis-pini]